MSEQQKTLYMIALLLVNSGLLGTVVLSLRRWLESRMGTERLHTAMGIAYQVVTAVQQIASQPNTYLSNAGKMDVAVNRAMELGRAHGVNLDEDRWRVLIEAGVKAMKDSGPLLLEAPPAPPIMPTPLN